MNYKAPQHASLTDPNKSRLTKLVLKLFWGVIDLVRRPAYLVPFLLNVTGSVWFFLLIGKAELSLTVPITNSLAFLFTVLGEWIAEGKVISRGMSSPVWRVDVHVTDVASKRYVVRNGFCSRRYRIMRVFEELARI